MRVVNKQQFLALPEGTWFCPIDGLYDGFPTWLIKDENVGEYDYYETNIGLAACCSSDHLYDIYDMMASGASHPMALKFSRNGLFDKDQQYVIMEKDDLFVLYKQIGQAMMVAEPIPKMTDQQRQLFIEQSMEWSEGNISKLNWLLEDETNAERKIILTELINIDFDSTS